VLTGASIHSAGRDYQDMHQVRTYVSLVDQVLSTAGGSMGLSSHCTNAEGFDTLSNKGRWDHDFYQRRNAREHVPEGIRMYVTVKR
jgi:hypothetical protein